MGCILCGLSDEVLPMVDNYPALWNWLQAMHRLPALVGYQRMYSKAHPQASARLSAKPEPNALLQGSACSQLLFWLGAAGLAALAPVTVVAVAVAMIASNPKVNSGSSIATEVAAYPQKEFSQARNRVRQS